MSDLMIPAALDRRGEEIGFHEYAGIFPLMDGEEYVALVEDIRLNGQREPIVLYGGKILDGRNRYRACLDSATAPAFEEYEGNDPLGYVVSLNLKRRHLNESQRAMVAAKLETFRHGDNQHSAGDANLHVRRDGAAKLLNVSERTVANAAKVRDKGTADLKYVVESGKVSVSAAADVATLSPHDQTEVVARGEAAILKKAAEIRQAKAKVNAEERAKKRAENPRLPDGTYDVIVCDPPWPMEKIERDVTPNQVGFEYPTMSAEELRAFDLPKLAAKDCHLFLWTTQKFLPLALELVEAWGFHYVLTMVWRKNGGFQPFNLPQYNCEFAVYARRGAPQFVDTKSFFTCFDAPRREHSRKPVAFYETIARVTDGQRIDLFSREQHEGFDQFGNERDKFAEAS